MCCVITRFRVIRAVLYVTFGIVGIAGCGVAVMQMGSDPAGSLGDLAVNSAVTAAGVGIFFFDRSVTANLREKVQAEMKNPYLKGDALMDEAPEE